MIVRAGRILRVCRRAARIHQVPLRKVIRRAAEVHLREGFTLEEAAPYGLLDPHLAKSEFANLISRKRLRPLQNALNPLEFSLLTEDKIVFYRYCEGLGLPTPRLYALFFRDATGWAADGRRLEGEDDWCSFFAEGLTDEFVLKPARSSYGIGVDVLVRDGHGFLDGRGRKRSPAELYDALAVSSPFDAFVLQERLANNPVLERLSGTRTLQTLRLNTLVERGAAPRILLAELKLVVGPEAVVDNLHGGRTGNISAEVSLADGTLAPATRASPQELGVEVFPAHPVTGATIAGEAVPDWEEACDLVRKASVHFMPLRTLGWDVALTPDGPALLEANMWWGPSIKQKGLGLLLHEVRNAAADLPRRSPAGGGRTKRRPRGLSPLSSANRLFRVAGHVRKAAAFYEAPFGPTLRQAMLVHSGRGFSLAEAADLGLLNPRLDAAELDEHVSRAALRPLQNRLNPASLSSLTEDKAVFYRLCEELQIPTPKLYALFFRGQAGWTHTGSMPVSREDWCDFISEGTPDEFVLKPANGHWGEDVGIYRRADGSLLDAQGSRYSPADLYDLMDTSPRYSNWVLQARLRNHPEIVRLSGTDTVQCARLITLVGAGDEIELLWAHFRAIVGDALYDNFRAGERGKLRVEIDRDDGRLVRAVGLASQGMEFVEMHAHPGTGVAFAGFRLPGWDDARRLVEQAALRFVPLRTLGWDVALTPAGPVIVEANSLWAPPNGLGNMPTLLRSLREHGNTPHLSAA